MRFRNQKSETRSQKARSQSRSFWFLAFWLLAFWLLSPVGVDQLARLQLGRIDDDVAGRLLEGLQAVVLDALELDLDHRRLRPLAVRREADVADDGVELVGVDVLGHLVLVEAADRADRLLVDLHAGIGVGRQIEAEL